MKHNIYRMKEGERMRKYFLVEFNNKTAGYFTEFEILSLTNIKIIHHDCFLTN